MKLDALIAFTQASYRNMKSYFTSKFIKNNKKKSKNQDTKTILVASSSIACWMLFASSSKFCLR